MDSKEETEAYLAKIRKTVTDAKALVEAANLRIAETDRLLAKQGITREQLAAMRFTPEQIALVKEELARRNLPPLVDEAEMSEMAAGERGRSPLPAAEPGETGKGVIENRTRKFGSMMQSIRL